MATLFDPVPTVAPQTNAAPGQNIRADPSAFGADVGRAVSGFGESVEKASSIGMDALIARQKMDNEVHASELNTWLADRITDRYGEYAKLEGRSAQDALPGFKADVNQLYQDHMAQAGSLQERTMLARNGRSLTDQYYRYAQMHADRQWRTWADKTAADRAGAYGAQAGIAAANNDDDGMNRALATSDDEVSKLYEQRGWGRQEIDVEVSKNRGRNLRQIIETQAVEDPMGAVNRLKKYGDQMDPATRLATANHLRPIITKIHGREIADEELGRAPAGQPEGGRSQTIMQKFQEAGYTPEQSAAAAGHFFHESRNNPNAVHDGGIGVGIAGWNGDRRAALEKFAAAQGKPANDFDTQVDFAIHELDTTENAAGAALKKAGNVEDATTAFMHYERPRGYTPSNPEQGDSYGARLGNAIKFANGNFSGALPDKATTFERIVSRTANNPNLQDAAITWANRVYSNTQVSQTQDAAAFKARYNDTVQESWRTGGVQQPMTRLDFLENMGPVQGPKAYGEYQAQLQLGTDASSLATMSPQERVTLLGKYEPKPGEGYAEAAKRYDALAKANDAVTKEALGDSGNFALTRLPAVRDAHQKMVASYNSDDPVARKAATDAFVHVTLAEQERIGIPPEQRNVLPKNVIDRMTLELMKPASGAKEGQTSADIASNIEVQAKTWGDNWPLVYKQIQKDAAPIIRVIGSGVTPFAARVLSELAPLKLPDILKDQDAERATQIKKDVLDAFKPFAASMAGSEDRLPIFNDFRGQAEKLAAYYVIGGKTSSEAAEQAFKDLLGHKYTFQEGYRVPKEITETPSEISSGALAAKNRLAEINVIAPARDSLGGLTAKYLQDAPIRALQRDGVWTTAPGDTGLMLVYNDEAVRTKAGQPLSFTWKQLADMGRKGRADMVESLQASPGITP